MKSIKNQYIALKEGKMTEAQFMRNVRMTLPEYISNVTLFKQAERILMNKGIISEIKINETLSPADEMALENIVAKYVKDADDIEKEMDAYFEKGYDGFSDMLKANLSRDVDFQTWVQKGHDEETFKNETSESINKADNDIKSAKQNGDKSYTVKYEDDTKKIVYVNDNDWDEINKKYGNLNEASSKYMISKSGSKSNPSYVIEKTDGSKQIDMFFDTAEDAKKYATKKSLKIIKEAKDTSATGYFNQDGKEQYGKFNELDNMNAQEIMAGYVMEKQDNPDIDIKEAIKTVLKNLKKDQFYYTNYKLSGVRDLQPTEFTTTKRKPFFDQMEELDKKGTNLVDEKNKMQVVKEDLNKLQKMNEVKRMQQLAGLIKESKLVRKLNENQEYSAELSVDNIKNIIKDTNRFYREDKTTIEETSDGSIYVSMNGSRLMGETRTTLEKLFDVREESEEFASDRLPAYTYFISTKTTSDQDTPQKDKDFDEDVFEGKKDKLKELVRKMMKEMFDERDNFTDIE
jgi:hypothetical protein